MLSELGLIDKLQKIEALYRGATTAGEKAAAAQVMANVQNKLESYRQEEKPTEWTLRVNNYFEKRLLKAILTKHGLSSYRYHGQRHTTLKVMATKSMINKVVWPQYTEMSEVLRSYFDEVTNDVIKRSMGQEESEDEIRQEAPQLSYQ
jgi:hypothetical protein